MLGLSRKINFTQGKLFKNMVLYAIPIAVATIIQLLFNAMDVIIVGNSNYGDYYIAAVGATSSATHLLVNLFIGIAIGTNVAVANAVGANDRGKQEKIMHSSIAIALFCGFLIMIVGVLICRPLLASLDVPNDLIANTGYTVLDKATTYMQIYFMGAPGFVLYNFCASIMRGMGKSDKPLIYLFIAGVLNVAINIVTVSIFNLDVIGVALGTIISQYLAAIWIFIDLMRGTCGINLKIKKIKFYKNETKSILYLGLPMGINRCCFSLSNIFISSTINSFGTFAIAGFAVANTIEGFLDAIAGAVDNTVVTSVGQNYGATKPDKIRKTVFYGLVMIIVSEVVFAVVLLLFGSQICTIFGCEQESIGWAMKKIYILGCNWALVGLMYAFGSGLKGMGSSISPMVVNLFFNCIMRLIYVELVFPYLPHIAELILVIYPVSWLLSGLVSAILYFIKFKHYKKSVNEIDGKIEIQEEIA